MAEPSAVVLAGRRADPALRDSCDRPQPFPAAWRADALLATLCAAVVSVACYAAARSLDMRWLDPVLGNDVWFEGDLARIFDEMTHRWAAHSRATVHPLFSLLTVVPMYGLRFIGCSPLAAMATVVGVTAGCWTLALYLLMRLLRVSRAEATLFTALGATSAAAMFWLTVPETYAFGSTTILAALVLAGFAERRDIRARWFVVVSAATLSITVTNWIAGILATLSHYSWRRTVQITANAFVAVVAVWAVQRMLIPRADFFVGYSNEQRYVLRPEAGGPGSILTVMFAHSVVMPKIETAQKAGRGTVMSIQHSPAGSAGIIARIATACWAGLLLVGAWASLRSPRESSRLPQTIMLVLGAEIGLHLLYGTETFLYTLNVVPLLIAIAAVGTRTAGRRWVVALACVLLACGAINNGVQLRRALRVWSSGFSILETGRRVERVDVAARIASDRRQDSDTDSIPPGGMATRQADGAHRQRIPVPGLIARGFDPAKMPPRNRPLRGPANRRVY